MPGSWPRPTPRRSSRPGSTAASPPRSRAWGREHEPGQRLRRSTGDSPPIPQPAKGRSMDEPVLLPRGEGPGDPAAARPRAWPGAAGERRALAAALARLSVADRNTLLLVAWGELSYGQAASALRVPVGTVRSRLNRARRKVREALGDTSPIQSAEEPDHE